jgi:hypothetical protein
MACPARSRRGQFAPAVGEPKLQSCDNLGNVVGVFLNDPDYSFGNDVVPQRPPQIKSCGIRYQPYNCPEPEQISVAETRPQDNKPTPPPPSQAPQFNRPYDLGMNGGNPGASQWFKLNIEVSPNGVAIIHVALENDVVHGWSGSFRFDFKELTGPNTDALLFRVDSPTYNICAKPPGPAIREQADDITVSMPPDIAQRFIAHPSMYGVKMKYDQGEWFFCGSGKLLEQAGQAIFGAATAK